MQNDTYTLTNPIHSCIINREIRSHRNFCSFMFSNFLFAHHEHNIERNRNNYAKTHHHPLQYFEILFLALCQTSCSIIESFHFYCTIEVSNSKRPVPSQKANVSDCASERLTQHKQIPWKVATFPLPLLRNIMILFERTYNWS